MIWGYPHVWQTFIRKNGWWFGTCFFSPRNRLWPILNTPKWHHIFFRGVGMPPTGVIFNIFYCDWLHNIQLQYTILMLLLWFIVIRITISTPGFCIRFHHNSNMATIKSTPMALQIVCVSFLLHVDVSSRKLRNISLNIINIKIIIIIIAVVFHPSWIFG